MARNNFNIILQPRHRIKHISIFSENYQTKKSGNIGYTNLRGRTSNSFEKQLSHQVQSEIVFNSSKSYEELKKSYSHIVLATGDADYANKLNNYQNQLTVTLKGSVIKGTFETTSVSAWFNNKLAPGGYGYLIPIDKNTANLVIGYPDNKNTKKLNSEYLWKNFLYEVSSLLKQRFEILTHFEINNYIIGLCSRPVIKNSYNKTYFVGNNFGSIMPFLGFGQIEAILTGIYAAYDICGQGDYNKLTKSLKKSNQDSLILRNSLEKLNNAKYDLLVQLLKFIPENILFQTKLNYLKAISKILKLYFR